MKRNESFWNKNYKMFRHIIISEFIFRKYIYKLLSVIDDKTVILYTPTENPDAWFFRLWWIKDQEVPEYCPQILWPNIKPKIKSFNSASFKTFIKKIKTNSSCVILKSN